MKKHTGEVPREKRIFNPLTGGAPTNIELRHEARRIAFIDPPRRIFHQQQTRLLFGTNLIDQVLVADDDIASPSVAIVICFIFIVHHASHAASQALTHLRTTGASLI